MRKDRDQVLESRLGPGQSVKGIRLLLLQVDQIVDGCVGVGGGGQQRLKSVLNSGRQAAFQHGHLALRAPELAERDGFEQTGHELLDDLVY
jgi:hypothetical protein